MVFLLEWKAAKCAQPPTRAWGVRKREGKVAVIG